MKSALYKTGQESITDGAFSSAVAVHAASRRWGNFSAMAEHMDIGRLVVREDKAPEGWSTPRRFALMTSLEPRASVLECGGLPPLSAVRPKCARVN